jgi:uncharacterized phage infection (PIP) family protein YhgE
MPDNKDKFDLVTTELEKSASAFKELQALLEKYKSTSEQMDAMKTTFINSTTEINLKLVEATGLINRAVVELKPIGTAQITDALEELKTDFESASTDLKSKLGTLDTAVDNIEKSSEKIDTATTSIPEKIEELIEGQNKVLLKPFTDIFETNGPYDQLKSSISDLESEDGQLSKIQASIKSMTAENGQLQKMKSHITSRFPTLEKKLSQTEKKNSKAIAELKDQLSQKFFITYAAIGAAILLSLLNLFF